MMMSLPRHREKEKSVSRPHVPRLEIVVGCFVAVGSPLLSTNWISYTDM